jgi:hypothetical protein
MILLTAATSLVTVGFVANVFPPRPVTSCSARRRESRFRSVRQVRGTGSVNVLPTPTVLSTVRSPPIPRAKSRLIARPKPVPPVVRVRSECTCTKRSEIRSSCSGAMPRRPIRPRAHPTMWSAWRHTMSVGALSRGRKWREEEMGRPTALRIPTRVVILAHRECGPFHPAHPRSGHLSPRPAPEHARRSLHP